SQRSTKSSRALAVDRTRLRAPLRCGQAGASLLLQSRKVDLAGVVTVDALLPGQAQQGELLRLLLLSPFHQAKRLAHDLARRAVTAGRDLVLDEIRQLLR